MTIELVYDPPCHWPIACDDLPYAGICCPVYWWCDVCDDEWYGRLDSLAAHDHKER